MSNDELQKLKALPEVLEAVARDCWNATRMNPQARACEKAAETLRDLIAKIEATPSSANGAEELPELPPLPTTVHCVRDGLGGIAFMAYAPEEMQAYARAAVLAEREAIAKMIEAALTRAEHLDDSNAQGCYSVAVQAIRARK